MGQRLGQHFLSNKKTIQMIVDNISLLYQQTGAETIIEIGPGKGAITMLLHNLPKNFLVIEKDDILIPHLQNFLGVDSVIHNDILEVDIIDILRQMNFDPNHTLVVGNLPYYITSPILRRCFEGLGLGLAGGYFMIQKEVGHKIAWDSGKKSYLWWLLNYAYHVQYDKTIPPRDFSPPPKVDSCLIQFTQRSTPSALSFELLQQVVEKVSVYKRKTLGKIATMIKKRGGSLPVLPVYLRTKRLEELGWKEMEAWLGS